MLTTSRTRCNLLTALTVYLIMNWFGWMCYGFVLMFSSSSSSSSSGLPSAGGDMKMNEFFRVGNHWTYTLHSDVSLYDDYNKDNGFRVDGVVDVKSIWQGGHNERLLKFEVRDLKLFTSPRKVGAGYDPHPSPLDSLPSHPFYVLWKEGHVLKVMLRQNEPLALANLKKSVVSLLQFQLKDGEYEELDINGRCSVVYDSARGYFTKTKYNCKSDDFYVQSNTKPLLDTLVKVESECVYQFDTRGYVEKVRLAESHFVYLTVEEAASAGVSVKQELSFVSESKCEVMRADLTFDDILMQISNVEGAHTIETLLAERENAEMMTDAKMTFEDLINANRDHFKSKLLGSVTSAKAFQNVIGGARKASRDDIAKTLKAKANKKILSQLFDILGYVQTSQSHQAAMKVLHFDDAKKQDAIERYLWALSFCAQPNPEILTDLISKYKKTQNVPEKIKETMILTIASMAYHLNESPAHLNTEQKLFNEVEDLLVNYLDGSKGEVRFTYLRALKNLRSPTALPTLLKLIERGSAKEGVLAWKAISALPASALTKVVYAAAKETFFQLKRKHDSSARTLALDVLLTSNSTDSLLTDVLGYLYSNDAAFEIKRYTIERLSMLMEEGEGGMRERLMRLIRTDGRINNYSTLGPKGLSVALTRRFMDGDSSNGSLLSVQEMHNGIVKRGIVNVLMSKKEFTQEIFSLGIFSGGLGSFLSSDSDGDKEDDGNPIAGMELTVLGTQIRPFVFFNGQGELMGHVWSGTASDRTTAWQALVMLQDHQQSIRLGNGMILDVDVKGVTSFDLSGQIQFSLWNRNAQSLVEKSAGIVVIGQLRVDSSLLHSRIEFTLSAEPKLKLETDVDFSANVNLCMKLTQPVTVYRHNICKIERIPGSKHKLRQTKSVKYHIPGRTYALNKKNSDMCNVISK